MDSLVATTLSRAGTGEYAVRWRGALERDAQPGPGGARPNAGTATTRQDAAPAAGKAGSTGPRGLEDQSSLDPREQQELERLQQRDREVRQHEQAHIAAGGQYVRGGAQLSYTRGPDGRQYATGGEVSIDVSPESTPQATIAKAQVVRRAALAPANPSPQDRQVAAQATQMELEARQQLAEERQAEAVESRGEAESIGAIRSVGQVIRSYQEAAGDSGTPPLRNVDLFA